MRWIRNQLAHEIGTFDSDIVEEYEKKDMGMSVTKVQITTQNSAKLLGKPNSLRG